MNYLLDAVRKLVRGIMAGVARGLNRLSGGKLRPNTITIVGLLMHLPIAWLIATGHNLAAAILLVIFGLFDTLDGELARLQRRASSAGMFLDSVTDRMKEILIYSGAAYAIITRGHPYWTVWAVLACGAAVLVSYTNAWGEAVMASHSSHNQQQNKRFRSGLMGFDIRIAVFIVGLLTDKLILAVVIIAIGAWITVFQRMANVMKHLR